MSKLEKRDEFIKGTSAGAIGAIAKYTFNEIAQALNFAKYDNNATAITVIMRVYEHTTAYWLFGFLSSVIIGAFFGLIIAFMFSYIFNSDHYLLKGAAFGVGIWLLNFGLLANVFHYPHDMQSSLGDVITMLLSLIIYSVVTTYSLKSFGLFDNE